MNRSPSCGRVAASRPLLLAVLLVFGGAVSAQAANCTSARSGNWSSSNTWNSCGNGAPQAGDSVTINSGHTVTLNTDPPSLASLTNYGTLTDSGHNRTLTMAGNVVNAGTLSLSSTTIVIAGNAAWSGEGSWSLGTIDFNWQGRRLTLAAGGAFTLNLYDSTPITGMNGAASFNAGGTNTTATVNFARSGDQTISTSAVVYPNVTLSGNGTKSMSYGTLDVRGNLTIGTGTTLSESGAIDLYGDLINNGSFSASWDTFTFRGASTQTVTGAMRFYLITVNNAAGVALNSDLSVRANGTLTLTSGNVVTNANALVAEGDCSGGFTLNRINGYVSGNMRLAFPGWPISCIYPVGDAIGYAPVTVTTSGSGTLTARVDAGDHPDGTAYTGIDSSKSANHHWTLTAGTLATTTSYSATFRFCATTTCTAAEVDAGATTGNFIVMQKSGVWSKTTTGTRTGYSTQASGMSGFGEFAVGEPGTMLCFADTFDRNNGAPGNGWTVGRKYGSFTPAVTGNRLRLTDTGGAEGTWVTLARTFPAAGNKITVEFDHYAYNGTGADGVAMILSNAAIGPVVGAFGGSLGYAPKSNPGSDCTISGGCPGFTGGWLGLAIDEWGNFQNPTEGRTGGPGQIPDSVSLRGSGSGMSGYRWLSGSATLSPGIDGNFSPAHHYRITVDHSDGAHAYVTVERDTTSGGANYQTVIPQFDALNIANAQDAVPTNWLLSFTGSSGGSTNIHEIDSLKVCTTAGLSEPTLHHIRIEHGGTACVGSGSPASITIKACASQDCSTLYLGTVTANLNWGAWSSNPVTFSGGQTTVTLTQGWTGTYTLGGTATSPTTPNATDCYSGSTQTCQLNFINCYFDAVETGKNAFTPIYTKLAGTLFNLDVKNLSGATQTVSKVEVVDADTGSDCGSYAHLSDTTTGGSSWSFTGSQTRGFSFNYADAVRNARIRVTASQWLGQSATYCSVDNFAIRPAMFLLTSTKNNTGTTGDPKLKAGSDTFPITATAVTGGSATTSRYTSTPVFDLTTPGVVAGTPNVGSLSAAVFGAASGGTATAAGIAYSEVGQLVLNAGAVNDDVFTAVDSNKGDCAPKADDTPDTQNAADANGRYGCVIGSNKATFGRFIPDHFGIKITPGCGAFTYSGQPFAVKITAYNGAGTRTKNYQYDGTHAELSFAKAVTLSDAGTSAIGCTQNCSVAAALFTDGTNPDTDASGNPALPTPTFTFSSALTAPTGIRVRATDTDGVASNPASDDTDTTTLRSGRLRLFNVNGSELLALPIPMRIEYWNGAANGWVTNADDACTILSAGNFAFGFPGGTAAKPNNLAACETAMTVAGSAPNYTLTLAAPGAGNAGWTDVTLNLAAAAGNSCTAVGTASPAATTANTPWLQYNWTGAVGNPSARATFGVFKSGPVIYRREMY